ncbi:DUF4389 domain-containing protein [Reichenbachiella versicolor]|uniref:DUF4389 domain-containing protein n=1 Tax=Reichenbachiella versicolor TaxID=1821036 RepID=UPI000D6E6122|nr:DUF4389 domain-containing protein [Reichenbachiella versicolor]
MTFEVKYQESYSRGELLLRSLFGVFYIALPHLFLLLFLSIWSQILTFISFWIILFTGSYPESFFDFQVKLMQWSTRVNLRLYNLSDGYPAFGLSAEDEAFKLDIPYPENLSRGTLLLKAFFGWLYVLLPHGIALGLRSYATLFLNFLAFWVVLFTGSYPESWFRFNVGTLRWGLRLNLYLSYMSDDYPPFSGK